MSITEGPGRGQTLHHPMWVGLTPVVIVLSRAPRGGEGEGGREVQPWAQSVAEPALPETGAPTTRGGKTVPLPGTEDIERQHVFAQRPQRSLARAHPGLGMAQRMPW